MFRKLALSASAGTAALLAAGSVFAQAGPTIVVAFSGAASDVPLDPWSSMAAAFFIVVIAAAIFRRRIAGVPRPGLWMAAAVAVTGAAVGSIAFNAIPDAHALAPTPLLLSTSPASIVIGFANADVVAQNATGSPIRLTSVVLNNAGKGQAIQTPPTTCLAGLVLAPAQSCLISVSAGS